MTGFCLRCLLPFCGRSDKVYCSTKCRMAAYAVSPAGRYRTRHYRNSVLGRECDGCGRPDGAVSFLGPHTCITCAARRVKC